MNAKKAKSLRRYIKAVTKPSAPYRCYIYEGTTRFLGDCIRGHYQRVKRGLQNGEER